MEAFRATPNPSKNKTTIAPTTSLLNQEHGKERTVVDSKHPSRDETKKVFKDKNSVEYTNIGVPFQLDLSESDSCSEEDSSSAEDESSSDEGSG